MAREMEHEERNEQPTNVIDDVTLAQKAYRLLRGDIIRGDFKPRQSLRLDQLRQRYGLSFSPLREALNRLRAEGLVQFNAARGFRIAEFSREEIWDAIETRILIECEALRRSIAAGDDDWEAGIVATFHAFQKVSNRIADAAGAAPSEEIELLELRHHDFHLALISRCHSRRLLELGAQLYAQTERYRRPMLYGRTDWPHSRNIITEHQELMDVTLARDTERAVSLLAAHYRRTAQFIDDAIVEQEDLAADEGATASKPSLDAG